MSTHHDKRWGQNIHLALVGTLDSEAEVLSLDGAQGAELSLDVRQVQAGNLLVKNLGQDVDADLELASLGELDVLGAPGRVTGLVQHDLGQDLVGEGAGHDERGVASGAAKVDKAALGEEDDVTARGHLEAVDLGLDVLDALGVGLEPGNVNLNVEVADVLRSMVSK
jgi:hypothetical protein